MEEELSLDTPGKYYTKVNNVKQIVQSYGRSPREFLAYLANEYKVGYNFDELSVGKTLTKEQLLAGWDKYKKSYIQCVGCKSYKTKYIFTRTNTPIKVCDACGTREFIKPKSFMYKNIVAIKETMKPTKSTFASNLRNLAEGSSKTVKKEWDY
jgi:translation initiation factor 2 beta subunit (eIF-2beta)/eIF-5